VNAVPAPLVALAAVAGRPGAPGHLTVHLAAAGHLAAVPLGVAGDLGVAGQPGAGWHQVADLALALLLSAVIGLEREIRQKSAGLRTHTLVGAGAALFMIVSKYGFGDVLVNGHVSYDPSRVAAQIVTGVGFLGAGLIFVQRGSVRGLTTAAAVWVAAAIGAAAGAGLYLIAVAATIVYLLVMLVFPLLSRRLPRSATAISAIVVRYPDGRGILRQVLRVATGQGFVIDEVSAEIPRRDGPGGAAIVEVTLQIHGRGSVDDLAATLSELEGVEAVAARDVNAVGD
jgi:putative Mg2+ transporter-C (MgtC) family protein